MQVLGTPFEPGLLPLSVEDSPVQWEGTSASSRPTMQTCVAGRQASQEEGELVRTVPALRVQLGVPQTSPSLNPRKSFAHLLICKTLTYRRPQELAPGDFRERRPGAEQSNGAGIRVIKVSLCTHVSVVG